MHVHCSPARSLFFYVTSSPLFLLWPLEIARFKIKLLATGKTEEGLKVENFVMTL